MIAFFFKVGKAFIEYTNHPITIPREHNSRLIEEIYESSGGKTIPIIIKPPKGRTLNGEIYYGISGYGPYYQIKVLGSYPSDYFGDFKIGEYMAVRIERFGKKVSVEIFSPDDLKKIV